MGACGCPTICLVLPGLGREAIERLGATLEEGGGEGEMPGQRAEDQGPQPDREDEG